MNPLVGSAFLYTCTIQACCSKEPLLRPLWKSGFLMAPSLLPGGSRPLTWLGGTWLDGQGHSFRAHLVGEPDLVE